MVSIRMLEKALEASKLHVASCEERFYLNALKELEAEIDKLENKNKEAGIPYELY